MFGCDPGAVRSPGGARLCQAAEASAGRARKMKAADGVMGGEAGLGFYFPFCAGLGRGVVGTALPSVFIFLTLLKYFLDDSKLGFAASRVSETPPGSPAAHRHALRPPELIPFLPSP